MGRTKNKRDRTAFWCTKCRRMLRNDLAASGVHDTVTPTVRRHDLVTYKHDQCKGQVVAGG